jgi:hypothetical protein
MQKRAYKDLMIKNLTQHARFRLGYLVSIWSGSRCIDMEFGCQFLQVGMMVEPVGAGWLLDSQELS